MGLELLFDRQSMMKVVLLYTPSNSLSMYVQDVIKNRFQINKDSIKDIATKKELQETKELYNVVPFLSQKWLFHVKNGDKAVKKDFLRLARGNTSGVYFIEFENYRNYKFVKDLLRNEPGTVDLYMGWLKRADFEMLYRHLVVGFKGYELTKTLQDFVIRGYANEIEAVFKLFVELRDGREVKTRKEIIDICGINSNTVDNFMFSLLKEPPVKDKGLKRYMSNRIKEAVDLAEKYTWSTFRNYLKRSVRSCIDVKLILSSGEIYDNIRNYENEGYDMKKLRRMQRYLPQLKEISMARLLGLLDNIEKGVWYTDLEFLNFFFNYMLYKYNSNKEVKKLILEARALVKQKENKAKSEPKEKRVIMQAHSPDKEDNVKPMTRKEENDRVQVRDFFRRKLSNE
ncbi:hypothetical protein P4493_05335 [Bacillus thuringiensis]|uniref:Replication initiation protein n=5 Tax=Bacteria TaxID=2 RepID=A0AB33AQC8_BACTU|nr:MULTISPECIES: hypothetical protein [Bacillus]MEC2536177.1 hypothetical protein [Bacillus cereus]MED1153581.1 hypothetical protein [Bacillus paranthracis]AFQ29908.1 hypothetical protein BTF1_29037 [Bacillus thuringiensis HD-789]AJG73814.1 hypothetical protein BF38_5696 [Bacillus thuringiensis]AJH02691.1 hypothetical protein AS86_6204 [Bacillus thuringiensis HD1002]